MSYLPNHEGKVYPFEVFSRRGKRGRKIHRHVQYHASEASALATSSVRLGPDYRVVRVARIDPATARAMGIPEAFLDSSPVSG